MLTEDDQHEPMDVQQEVLTDEDDVSVISEVESGLISEVESGPEYPDTKPKPASGSARYVPFIDSHVLHGVVRSSYI